MYPYSIEELAWAEARDREEETRQIQLRSEAKAAASKTAGSLQAS